MNSTPSSDPTDNLSAIPPQGQDLLAHFDAYWAQHQMRNEPPVDTPTAGEGMRVDGNLFSTDGTQAASSTDRDSVEVVVTGVLNGVPAYGTALYTIAPVEL